MGLQIAPSVLAADLSRLAAAAAAVAATADWLHVDVMDNHFVPNLTIGLPVVECLRTATDLPLDCHLMIDDPDRWAPPYAEAGAESVTFHVEAAADPAATARAIRAAGGRAGLAVKPGTPLAPYEDLLAEFDLVLVMTVEPGFGGQSFRADMLPKVAAARDLVRRLGLELWVQVDGGVDEQTIASCAAAGADVFVAGSAVYRTPDPDAAVERLRAAAAAGSAAGR
jgi:ribulose-phosphate 3-epimerase